MESSASLGREQGEGSGREYLSESRQAAVKRRRKRGKGR